MRTVLERLDDRLVSLNERITEKRQDFDRAQEIQDSVRKTLSKLERVRTDLFEMKKLWIVAKRDDPFPE